MLFFVVISIVWLIITKFAFYDKLKWNKKVFRENKISFGRQQLAKLFFVNLPASFHWSSMINIVKLDFGVLVN